MTCDICQDSRLVRLPKYAEVNMCDQFNDGMPTTADPGWKEFPCPQCTPQVPYKRVRAMKVAVAYDAETFGKMQVPIERGLAARFGEYLMREGLIRFTTEGSTDFGRGGRPQITITAHLGVVSRENVAKSGAVEEVAFTKRPPLPKFQRERVKVSVDAVAWTPAPWKGEAAPDEFEDEEPKSAISNRFSGLEI